MALLLRPLDAPLAGQLAELARLTWTDGSVTAAAAESFGWMADGSMMNAYMTPGGHPVHPECFGTPGQDEVSCLLSFAYLYEQDEHDVRDERDGYKTNLTWIRRFYAEDDRWVFDQDAGRAAFDTTWRTAAELFTAQCGEPEVSARIRDDDEGCPPWNYTAWRCGDNALIVGQCSDFVSFSVFEQAVVWIGRYPKDEPFPEATDFWRLLEA
ncbi:hypothetical protein OG883_21095 [Streptomyces sp. NBC_01142]|uniref:hypothetical protein n=1 Tax=Streptomyces sp. NBC_01142 TaxID=2975865 RepID=UPI00224E28A7|nr:hypothetical protein [Streptomyces sp. NBC_01142]MCX4822340.1 hypothetical protein [Streptomyces sp. NBC_01142]